MICYVCLFLFSDPKSKEVEKKVKSKPWRANMLLKQPSTESPNQVEPEKAKEEEKVDEEEQRPWRKNMKKAEDHIKGKSVVVFLGKVINLKSA